MLTELVGALTVGCLNNAPDTKGKAAPAAAKGLALIAEPISPRLVIPVVKPCAVVGFTAAAPAPRIIFAAWSGLFVRAF